MQGESGSLRISDRCATNGDGSVAEQQTGMGRAANMAAGSRWRAARRGAALATFLGLTACAPTVIRHGHQFQDNDIQQVQTGMSNGQVMGLLGSPTTTATVNGGQTLYYISSTETQTAFFKPQETDRKILAIYFTQLGAVERVSQYGLKDGKVINFSANQTPNSARDENVIKQLFRKLGTKNLFGGEQ
jgi:outer membrane protein assembly factor BamE (lipoprotein component of BamABCDE complex)